MREVRCGRIAIDQSHLKWDSEQIPWDDLEQVGVDNGEFFVKREGRAVQKMDVSEMKTFDVLWALANAIGATRAGRRPSVAADTLTSSCSASRIR